MRFLVAFFSLDGSTKMISETIAQIMDADILELKPIEKLGGGNFRKHFWGGKQVIRKEKPELEPLTKNPPDYDFIFLGTPVWVGNFTPAIRTFLSQSKLVNKKIALFCCCDGAPGKTIENMKSELKGNDIVGELVLIKTSKNKEVNKKLAIEWAKKLL